MDFQSLVELAPWTTIAQICNLLLQIFLFKKFLFKPIKEIIAKASAKGVKIGCFADTVEGGKKWRDLGVKFIGYGCDTYIFMQAAKADVAAFAK